MIISMLHTFTFSSPWSKNRTWNYSLSCHFLLDHPGLGCIYLGCMWVAGGGSLGLNTCSSEWQNKVCWFGLAAANRETCGISSATVGFAGETSSCKKFHSVLCLPSTPPSAVARFSADTFLPLGIHLRQFVFPLFTASAFLSLLICSLPFPLPLFFIPPPPAATVLQSVCASLRHVWGVSSARRSTVGNWMALPPPSSRYHSSLFLSVHLRNREPFAPRRPRK